MRSQWVQVAIVLGFALLLALLDWSINHSWRATVAAGVGVLLGLGILLASWARRRRSRS